MPMIKIRSAEEYLAELEEILRRYRIGAVEANARLTEEQALVRLRRLGFTAGEALRLLRPEKHR
ncbi:MAG TPA: hypothetical protein VJR47_08415 [Stellaceae bacterium]|nr:hypothetical protein [Stellaceae bacterium]